jgi:hypothetical protein
MPQLAKPPMINWDIRVSDIIEAYLGKTICL